MTQIVLTKSKRNDDITCVDHAVGMSGHASDATTSNFQQQSSNGNETSTVFIVCKRNDDVILVLIRQIECLAILVTPPLATFNNKPRELTVNSLGN